MLKRLLIGTTLTLLVALTAVASSEREDDVNRTHKAAQVFREIMNTPHHGITTTPDVRSEWRIKSSWWREHL
jgi:hypothetical protein